MQHSQLLFTLFCIVFTCLGWRIVTDNGQLLYFLRKPFEGLNTVIEEKKSLLQFAYGKDWQVKCAELNRLKLKEFLSKPMVTCITCMASVWGSTIFIVINGITLSIAPYLIISCLAAAFIQTFIWNLYEKYL